MLLHDYIINIEILLVYILDKAYLIRTRCQKRELTLAHMYETGVTS